ncbi:MAG: hypothetical protein KF809_16965 [Chloroflexi bacterium]|nr:hypothetical protein [Chloroflexota bacterium]
MFRIVDLGEALEGLAALGHRIERWPRRHPLGGSVCAIRVLPDGVLSAAADTRHMCWAAGW